MTSRVFRVVVRSPKWRATGGTNNLQWNTTIAITSDVLDSVNGRTVNFREIGNRQRIEKGYSVRIESGNRAQKANFRNNGAWETLNEWLVCSEKGVLIDTIAPENQNNVNVISKSGFDIIANNELGQSFSEGLPQAIDNAKYATGRWAWDNRNSTRRLLDRNATAVSSMIARGKFSDLNSFLAQAGKLKITNFKEINEETEATESFVLPEMKYLVDTADIASPNALIGSWFRDRSSDDFLPQSKWYIVVNFDTSKYWYLSMYDDGTQFAVSPEYNLSTSGRDWSTFDAMSQIVNIPNGEVGAIRNGIIQTNLTRAQFNTNVGGNQNTWYIADKIESNEFTGMRGRAIDMKQLYKNTDWWATNRERGDYWKENYMWGALDSTKGTISFKRIAN